jgi:hypothetical protein
MTIGGRAVLACAFAFAWAVMMILVFGDIGWGDWFVWLVAAGAAIALVFDARRRA